ncbi:MAG: hypothetical protein ACTH7O_01715 [Microbacterium gubbeenense]|uniref:hypothetical protein n=1 Tax=Microbacterium gubbeenense TaxID=159896 RepID=UPI003F9D894E
MAPENPLVVRSLAVSALVWAVVGLFACAVGYLTNGFPGLGSAATGAGAGSVFSILTSVILLVPDRRYGTRRYAAIAFFSFLGGFLVKIVLFIVSLMLLLGIESVVPGALYGALAATAVASLIVDLIIVNGIRVPGDDSGYGESS